MKPPVRRRVAPIRLQIDPAFLQRSARGLWTKKEKLCLLKCLKAQAQVKELNLEMLMHRLPRKTEGEIIDYIQILKGQVAREAIRKEYSRHRAETERMTAELLAPIEVWTDLAKKVSDKLEEAVTSAFSQMLTIAATEPTSLLHSIPTKPTKVPGRNVLRDPTNHSLQRPLSLPASSNVAEQASRAVVSPETATPSQQESPAACSQEGRNPNSGDLTVDFENIYRYLCAISRGTQLPVLSSFESAVLLDLLLSLPKELTQMDCFALKTHMQRSFRTLNVPRECSGGSKEQSDDSDTTEELASRSRKGTRATQSRASSMSDSSEEETGHALEDDGSRHGPSTSCKLPSHIQTPAASPTHSGKLPAPDTRHPWKDLGVCPLNLFMVPIKLLSQVDKDEA